MEEIFQDDVADSAPWDYRSEPPYELIYDDLAEYALISVHGFDNLPEAVARFARFHVGPMPRRSAAITDGNKRIVLCCFAPDETALWIGTGEGFDELARHHDPLAVLDWEIEARSEAAS